MLEERNDSYKSTATQSQTKILQLEQEKVVSKNFPLQSGENAIKITNFNSC